MRPLKVGQVNTYIKKMFATDMILSNIEIEGEISNYNHHYSGHRYFSLKDNTGKIKCVMFKSYGQDLKEKLEEGQNIIAKGYISVYEKTGEYQLYVKSIEMQGIGELYRKYEELKLKLEAEGLFSSDHKKKIPSMPRKIGIVTSATGAAVEDMIDVITRRFPATEILIYPSLVQGNQAAREIVGGLSYLDKREDVDLIIIGRGGGSIDELFAFNDETLARTIYHAATPIISAVGHETDFTISDFVADLRAATPSVAAELAVPNISDLKENLSSYKRYLISDMESIITSYRSGLKTMNKELNYSNPIYKIGDRRQGLDFKFEKLANKMNSYILRKKNVLGDYDKKIQLLNPAIGLDKGQAILTNKDGKLIKSVEDLGLEEEFRVNMQDGKLLALVKEIEKGDVISE